MQVWLVYLLAAGVPFLGTCWEKTVNLIQAFRVFFLIKTNCKVYMLTQFLVSYILLNMSKQTYLKLRVGKQIRKLEQIHLKLSTEIII